MTVAGYSGTLLPQKLAIKEGTIVVAIDAPENYRKLLGKIPGGVNFATRPVGKTKFVHLFVKERRALEKHLQALRQKIGDDATLWVSWPKEVVQCCDRYYRRCHSRRYAASRIRRCKSVRRGRNLVGIETCDSKRK